IMQEMSGELDIILVGDSLSSVIKGEQSTVRTFMQDVIYHTACVRKGSPDIFVVSDLPFMSYQSDVKTAVENAGRLVRDGGANAVKLEGGREFIPQIRAITDAGIPVMGHLGLTPQFINSFGSYNARGKEPEERARIKEDALLLEKAGVFAVVLECVPASLGKEISETLTVPVIGIGAGPHCDGQVLVLQDMLGMNDNSFRFLRKYASLKEVIKTAFSEYINDVRNGDFPDDNESYR
ncbi:MAG: 3-methyl-2-oxobutanoate hydroxymethyltransferase, partial [Candidatus Muiribacteriaceae bacterium]